MNNFIQIHGTCFYILHEEIDIFLTNTLRQIKQILLAHFFCCGKEAIVMYVQSHTHNLRKNQFHEVTMLDTYDYDK